MAECPHAPFCEVMMLLGVHSVLEPRTNFIAYLFNNLEMIVAKNIC